MSKTITVTLSATFEYDESKLTNLDKSDAEAMAIDAVRRNPELLTSSFEVEE